MAPHLVTSCHKMALTKAPLFANLQHFSVLLSRSVVNLVKRIPACRRDGVLTGLMCPPCRPSRLAFFWPTTETRSL